MYGGKNLFRGLAIVGLLSSLISGGPALAVGDAAPSAITPSSLGTLFTNLTLNQSLVADGSPAPVLAISSGSLPDGLSFANGSILGTPTTAGQYSFTVSATNSAGSFSQAFSGLITNGTPGVINPGVLPTLTAGVQSVIRFTTDGNPVGTITKVSGTIPTGMTFSAGALTGTPTSPGLYNFTLRSTNAFGSKDVIYSGSVLQKAPTAITPTSIGNLYTNGATSIALTTDGIPSANYTIGSGALPAGLSLNATTGAITGTATTPGAYSFEVVITNDAGSASRTYTGLVTNGAPVSFNVVRMPDISATDTISVQISTDGSPAPLYTIVSGSLPSGLSMATDGVVRGSTTATGAYSFTVRSTNSVGSLDQVFTGTVLPKAPTQITPGSIGNLYMTQAVNLDLVAVAYPSVVFTVSSGGLPAGLSLNANTGHLSGTPTVSGPYNFTISATQASSSTVVTRTYSGLVLTGSISTITPSVIDPIPGGQSYSLQIQSDAHPLASFSVTRGTLPTGLTMTTAGLISGTPTALGTFSFTVTGTSADNATVSRDYTVQVVASAPTAITPDALPTITAGTALANPIQLSANGLEAATFALTAGSLPAGLTMTAGAISGTPTTAGAYSFVITATNSAGSFSKTYRGNVQSRTCPTSTCVFNNHRIRFGNGSENSINGTGLVNQPWYFSAVANGWRQLTFATYPLNLAISVGASGNYPPGAVTDLSENSSPSVSNQDIDYREFVITSTSGGASLGYGKITVKTTFSSVSDGSGGTKSIEVTNVYELGENDNFVKITTVIKNVDTTTLNNVIVFAGTQDDYVGTNDRPTKVKGNLVNGVFTPITNASNPASVLQITSGAEGVLFYSTTPNVNMSINSCCQFDNALRTNPTSSQITVTNDGSYAAHLPFGDIASGASSTLTWFYAAGATAELSSVTQAIASAAAPPAPRVSRGNGLAILSWEAPVTDDPIVNYTVRYRAESSNTWINVPLRNPETTVLSQEISGLTNGNTYVFQVAAITRASLTGGGTTDVTGAWSGTSLPALIGYPDAPSLTSAVGGNGQVVLNWTPGNSDASPILNYEYSVDGGVSWITIYPAGPNLTSYTITDLPNGGAYQVQFRAINQFGTSAASNTIEVYTTPVWVDRFINSMAQNIAYSDGVSAASNVSSYTVTSGALPAGISLNATTGAITGTPTALGAYSFTITAQNSAATLTQEFSGSVAAFGLALVTTTFNLDTNAVVSETILSSQSTGLSLSPTGATFSWVSGSLPNGVTATFQNNGVFGVYPSVVFSGQPTVTGTFTRTLRITDGAGRTSNVTLTFVVVRALTGAPTIGSPTFTAGTLTVPFTDGAAGTSPISKYQYTLDNGATWIDYLGGTTSPLTIPGLTNGNYYQVKIRGVNDAGASSSSNVYNLLMEPAFTETTLSPMVKDTPYSDGIAGGAQLTYSITSGTLPAGLTLNTTTGVISGTPTTLEPYSFVLRATNSSGFVEITLTGTVVATLTPSRDSGSAVVKLEPIPSEAGKLPGGFSALSGGTPTSGGVRLVVKSDSVSIVAKDWLFAVKAVDAAGKNIAPAANGALQVERDHQLQLSGNGFLAGGKVLFYMMSTPTFIGELDVDSTGLFNGSLQIPSGVELGRHTLQLLGVSPNNEKRAVSLGFELVPAKVPPKAVIKLYFAPNSSKLTVASRLMLRTLVNRIPASATGLQLNLTGQALDIIKATAPRIARERAANTALLANKLKNSASISMSYSLKSAKVGSTGRAVVVVLRYTEATRR